MLSLNLAVQTCILRDYAIDRHLKMCLFFKSTKMFSTDGNTRRRKRAPQNLGYHKREKDREMGVGSSGGEPNCISLKMLKGFKEV